MKWFQGITSVEELRTEYKNLLLKHHPDNGGEVPICRKSIAKIFNNVISQEEDAIKMFKHVDEELDKLAEPYKEQFSDEQLEEIKDLMNGTALISEQEGFQLGIMYVAKQIAFIDKIV